MDFWPELLSAIEEERVVPIIGRDLLVVETETGPIPFHRLVAVKLAKALGVSDASLPPDFDPNDVVCASAGFHGDPTSIRSHVRQIVIGLKVGMPEPLRQLVEILPLRLFVSTTYDTLLEEALNSVRKHPPALVPFPPALKLTDFDDGLLANNGSVVFQLFGRISASADFAVTEGQVLNQIHDFMASDRRPEKLIAKLRDSHLLILGVSFPDWLVRILLRYLRDKPLWEGRPFMEVIADSSRNQQDLASFLRHFSPSQSRIFTGGSPVDFVKELNQRWLDRHPVALETDPRVVKDPQPEPMERGSIFISYAHEDWQAAWALADALAAANLGVWVDRRIKPGNDFKSIIEGNIYNCCAFIPVLSQNTQGEELRWFRREWELACVQSGQGFGTQRGFLFPVVADSSPMGNLNEMRRNLFGRSATYLNNGKPVPELIQQLDCAQKAWHKQNSGK